MRLSVDRKILFGTSIYIAVIVSLLLVGYMMIYTKHIYVFLGLTTLLHIIFSEILILMSTKRFFCFANIFAICLYLFHTGHIVIKLFSPDYTFGLDLENVLGYETYILSALFSLFFITLCVLGIVYSQSMNDKNLLNNVIPHAFNKKKLRFVGIGILLISFPFHLTNSILTIHLTTEGDYFDSFNAGTSGTASAFASFLVMAITVMMFAYSKEKTKLYSIYLVSVAYYAWTMLSGSRGKAVIAIVYLTFVLLKFVKISPGKLVIMGGGGYFALTSLTAIAQLRNMGNMSLDKILVAMSEVENPIVAILEEFGGTQQTVGLVIKWSEENAFKYGESYIQSVVSIFPNIGGIFTEINDQANFITKLRGAYIGGSLIGESYYNFGFWGIVIAIIIGAVVGRISMNMEKLFLQREYEKLALYTMPCYSILWWIRDAFNGICRSTVWSLLLIGGFYYVWEKILVRRNR